MLRRDVDGGDKSLKFDVVVSCSQEGRRESYDCWCEEHVERNGAEGVGGEGGEGCEGETRGRILLVCREYGSKIRQGPRGKSELILYIFMTFSSLRQIQLSSSVLKQDFLQD